MNTKVTTVFLLVTCASGVLGAVLRQYEHPVHLVYNTVLDASSEDNSTCQRHIRETISNILEKKWALEMLDASSKIPSGIMSGNIADLGAYDQCLRVDNGRQEDRITGQYCKITMPLKKVTSSISVNNDNMNGKPSLRGVMNLNKKSPEINFALCVPSSCSASHLDKILQGHPVVKYFEVKVAQCQTNETKPFSALDWCALTFFSVIALLIILCTVYDVILHYTDRKPAHIILVAFSFFSNGKKLLAISHNPNQLPCLNGIRFLSMIWVIMGHTYYTAFYSPAINTIEFVSWEKRVWSMHVLGATVSVDTFFLLAGILLSYVFLTAKEKGMKFNLFQFYIHRYIRLTPSLAAIILLHVSLLQYMGNGPNWPDSIKSLKGNCEQYWWSSLLYIQNFVNPNHLCIGQTWYLSVDTQLYVLSPLALLPLKLWPMVTLSILGILVIASMVVPFVITWVEKIPALMPFSSSVSTFGEHYYYSTYARFGPTILGLICGYIIFKRKEFLGFNGLLKNIYFNLGGWLIALTTMALIVFQPNNMFWHSYNQTESSVYLGVHRVIWSIAVAWIIYACIQGHGGIVNDFLSHPVFQVLSRLTYSMYLIHLSFQGLKIGYMRVPIYFGDFQNLYNFWGDCMMTLCLSLIWTLAFESPIIIIEKTIFGSPAPKDTKSNAGPSTK